MPFFNQKIFKALIFTAVCFSWLFLPESAQCLETHDVGIINVNRLNLRAEPALDAPVVKVLDKGDQVRILEHDKGWLEVFHKGDIGYIADQDDYVTLYTIHTVTDSHMSNLEKAKSEVKDFLQHIKQHQSEIDAFDKHEKEIIEQLNTTDLKLNQARQQSAAISAELAGIKDEISKKEKQAKDIEKEIDKGRGYAVKRLVALYKLNTLGEMNLFASATSVYDMQKTKAAVEKILQYDQKIISNLVDKRQYLSQILKELNKQKASKAELEKEQQDAVTRLAQEKARRKKILSDIRTQKKNRLATIKYLQDAAARLDRTISELSRESGFESNTKKSFSACQGLLKMPVKGKIISTYGTYTEPHSGATNFRSGIEIRAERGAPISAVFDGKVVYANWLKGYGNVIIINHGDNYYTVYAHADDLFKTKGDTVKAGDVIATVGDTGSMTGPTLYFEIRHHGNPLDPLKWIKKG